MLEEASAARSDVTVHMIALYEGHAHPMVWTRPHGTGHVAHIAIGHDERVWALQPYRQMLMQAVTWLGTN